MFAWGHVSLAKGQPERALRHAEDLLATVPGQPATQTIPELLALRGEALAALGDLRAAESAFEAALDGAVERHQLSLCWQIYRSIGHVRRLMNRSVDAELAYQAARQLLKQLAASIDDDQLRAHYLAAGLSSMPKERRQTPGPRLLRTSDGLTRRELEVAQMIAGGSTNRAIAERLFISEGTVRTHVKAIFRKLGVHSRTQIATWLLQRESKLPHSVGDG
jgi:DNA-binding CsgD family transcriptional regulator